MASLPAALRPRLLRPFAGEAIAPPPVWLMRQAGRYLPEYHVVRAQAGSFLKLCYTPALAAEVTLQPVRRFALDAAIVFSDILVVPDALGQRVEFLAGEGPRLEPVRSARDVARLHAAATRPKFAAVFETVSRVRGELDGDTALIGFCGAPWTVATYMVGGQRSADQAEARLWATRDAAGFQRLIDLLVDVSADYLVGQVEAGADLVQIFDSWAGSLPEDQLGRWVIAPTRALVARMKAKHPSVPVIGFPRGIGRASAAYVTATGVDGVSCDTAMALDFMANELADKAVVQGNLDPLLLAAGGAALERGVAEILAALSSKRFIFNLGHGIVPQTPPDNVALLVELVRRA
jgi:uroporphyrinogen decarboxylase